MQYKQNKNGVKLLAAVMVFAMAFAGAFVIMGGEQSDAEETSTPANSAFADAIEKVDAGATYKATADFNAGDVEITKNVTIDMDKYTMTIDGEFKITGTIEAPVVVTITNSTGVEDKTLLTTVGATGSIVLDHATLIIDMKSGKSVNNANGPMDIKLTNNSALNVNSDHSIQAVNIVAENSKINATNKDTTFSAYFDLTKSSVTATNLGVYAATLDKDSSITATKLGIYNGKVNPTDITALGSDKGKDYTINTIVNAGTINADTIGFGLCGDGKNTNTAKPTVGNDITISGNGAVTGNVTLLVVDKNTSSFIIGAGTTYNGTVINGDNKVVVSGIKAGSSAAATAEEGGTEEKVDGIKFTPGSIEITGTCTTVDNNNGRITVTSGDAKITGTLEKGVTLIIEETATVTKDSSITVADGATLEVYGTVVSEASVTNNGKMVITPTSNFNTIPTGNGSIVQNPDMEKAFYIGGELENSMPITNATLNDDLHIPEGMTLTVNGNFFLNGRSITVDGELIINKNASIYDLSGGKLIIGKGKITNNGIIGNAKPVSVAFGTITSNIEAVQMQGVSGVNFEVKKVAVDKAVDATGYKNVLIVSGDIGRISSVQKNELTISNAIIGDMTVAKRVTLVIAGDAVETASGTTLTVDGDISAAATKEITLGMNSEYNLNGSSKNVTVVVKTGELKNNTEFEGTPSKVKIAVGDNATGFSIYTKKVSVTTGSTTKYEMRAYIEGAVDKIVTPVTTETETAKKTDQTVTITGEFYVASGATLSFSKDVDLTKLVGTGFKANVQGTIAIDGQDNGNDVLKGNYVGAMYSITVKDGTAIKSETLYYTTFDAAIAIIADVDEKTVTSTITEVESDFTVGAEQTVNFVGTTVSSKATVTVENDGTVSKINVVEGMVVVKDGGNCSIPASGYAAKTVSEDNTTTYAGLKIAIENAKAGDVITISSGETGESLTIPAGVTVNVNNDLKVKGNLTVSEGAKLVIKGTLTMTSTDKDVTVDVIGTFDASAGSYVEGTKATLKSSGTSVFQNLPTRYSGAYYENDSNYYVTTVSKAVEGAVAAEQDTVYINGTVNDSTEISLKDMTLALNEGATVRLGNVNLDNSTVDADATGAKLTATVIGMNGDGDKAVSSSVKTSESNIVIVQTATEKADETVSNKFTVSTVNGTVTVATGNVNFASDLVMTDGKLIVDAGATLVLNVKTDINGGEFTVNGTVDVVGKVLTLAADKATVNGTVNVSKSGQVVLNKAIINGTVDVKTETDKTNKLTIATDGFAFGKPVESIGATASIIGNVEFGAGVDYIIAYPGIDLSQAIINADSVTKESTAVTTVFTVNGVEYATVYANEDSTKIGDVFELDQIKEIKGLDFKNVTALEWTDLDGEKKNSSNVGDVATVGAEFDYAKQTVTVSVGTGISLYIDGVKYSSGSTPELTIGDHKVTATVNPGYKGTVDIMVNGNAVTNGVFTIEVGKDVTVSAVGEISIDNGNTSASSSSDDGMGITDILLIVLVILAAILVVIVALRMMRS